MEIAGCVFSFGIKDFNPMWLTGVGGLVTAGAIIFFGIRGLRQYREGQRLKAADMLFEMEKEYREILPVCIEFELEKTYNSSIKPILVEIANTAPDSAGLNEKQLKKLKELDRALRFFYTCSVLNGELRVEQDVIGRVYYYYLSILADPSRGGELSTYVQKYFPRLHDWLQRHQHHLACYKKTGKWAASCPEP